MGYNFNGTTKRITLTGGTTEFITNDLYSRWKDWVRAGNANFLAAFDTIGGESIGGGQTAGFYLFLINGWSIVPAAVGTLTVVGNLVRSPDDLSGEPVFQQIGQQIQIIQRSSAVAIGYEAGGGTTITPAQIWSYATRSLTTAGNQAIASEIWTSQTNTFTTLGTVGQLIAQVGTQVDESYTFYGFKPGSPLVATITQHTAGGKRLLVSVDEGTQTTTITRDV